MRDHTDDSRMTEELQQERIREHANEVREGFYDTWKDDNKNVLKDGFIDENNDDFEQFCKDRFSDFCNE